MIKMFKRFVYSLGIIFLLSSTFYASDEPGGGDVPENVVNEPEPGGGAPDFPDARISQAKPKFLTLNLAIGTGEKTELEFGIRFTCYFRETAEKFNIGLIFGSNYTYAWNGRGQDTPSTIPSPGKRHYFSVNALAAFYIYGAHIAVGLDYNVKFKGPDSDEIYLNTVFYKKNYFSLDIEIGYLFMPSSNRFTVLLTGVIKRQLGDGSYENLYPRHDHHTKGMMILFRVQIGLFLF